MNSKRIVAVLVTLFVVAGAIVGYMNQLQTPSAGPAPLGIGYEIPGSAQSAVTFLATTSPAKGVLPGTYTSSYGDAWLSFKLN